MEIKTEVSRKIFDMDGIEVKVGDEVIFNFKEMSVVGIYNGITKKGALEFRNEVTDGTFSIMPSSITDMVHAGKWNE